MVNVMFAFSHSKVANFVGGVLSILPAPSVAGKGSPDNLSLLSGLLALQALCSSNKGA
jgi:hypothetical protein